MIITDKELDLNVNDLNRDESLVFDNSIVDFNRLCSFLQNVFDFELAYEYDFKLQFKALNKDIKIQLLRKWLLDENMSNSIVLLNIINLIKTYNTLSDDFFRNQNIIFNDITELLDIKIGIKNEIDIFVKNLCIWYLSLFVSVHKNESNYLDDVYEIPVPYKKLLLSLDFYTLSGICQKAKDFEISSLKCVKEAYQIVSVLSEKNNMTMKIFEDIQKNIK